MKDRKHNINEIAERIKDLDLEIQELGRLVRKAETLAKAEYRKQIHELFIKKEELQLKVDKIGQLKGDVWEDMKAGNEFSWDVFRDSTKKRGKKAKV